jgi:hypothetical protein
MVYGSLGECFFRSEHMDRAHQATRKALEGCLRSGDLEGIVTYSGNLVEICRKRGKADEARYWLIATTNAMIQTGQAEHAIKLRREHGIEPAIGLIKVQEPGVLS